MSATNERRGHGSHIDELVALHALGALEQREREQVEAHVAECARCARALGQAEETVATLDDAFVTPVEPPDRLGARITASAQMVAARSGAARAPRGVRAEGYYAMAAAFALATGLGGAYIERLADGRQVERDSAVVATIATSHFNHVSFIARAAAAPVAKVLYARDGAWLYVVIDSATCDCRVVARTAAGERDLGRPAVRGTTATLFVPSAARPAALALIGASGRVVSNATLVYMRR